MDTVHVFVTLQNSLPSASQDDELKLFRLTETDANFEEKRTALAAYINNMTSSEYRVKSNIASEKCGYTYDDAQRACFAMSMFAINRNEFDIRLKKFDLCIFFI